MNMIIHGDCKDVLPTLERKQFRCCVTSPPYYHLRDYGIPASNWPEISYIPMAGLPPITVQPWVGCLGLEPTPEMYTAHMVHIFREVWDCLKDDGTLWINLADTYVSTAPGTMGDNIHISGTLEATKRARKIMRPQRPKGLKLKDLMGIPWRVAFALQADGWYLRMDNIWDKLNCMPEAVKDRPTKAHEYIFLLAKRQRYFYNYEAVQEAAVGFNNVPVAGSKGASGPQQTRRRKGNAKSFRGGGAYTDGRSYGNAGEGERSSHGNQPNRTGKRNRRSVWRYATNSNSTDHYATFPEDIARTCVLAGSEPGDHVLDPFSGTATTGKVALEEGREYTGMELNSKDVINSNYRLTCIQPKMQFVRF